MIGSIIAPMAIRRVLQWQQLKSERHAPLDLRSLFGARAEPCMTSEAAAL